LPDQVTQYSTAGAVERLLELGVESGRGAQRPVWMLATSAWKLATDTQPVVTVPTLTSFKGRGDGYLRDRSSPRARRIQVRPFD